MVALTAIVTVAAGDGRSMSGGMIVEVKFVTFRHDAAKMRFGLIDAPASASRFLRLRSPERIVIVRWTD
jgi:hypothetical protein